jgi:hypothetical protein
MTAQRITGEDRERTARGSARSGSTYRRSCRRPSRLSHMLLAVLLGSVAVCLACAGSAFADSASLSVTNTAGQSDPAAGLPRVFTLSGNVAAPTDVFVKYRGPGGAPCAPNAESDTGAYLDGELSWDSTFYGASVEGDYAIHEVIAWHAPGPVVFCIWIASSEKEITQPITQTIDFRSPGGTITASIDPVVPQPNQQATVTVTGASEAPESVYAKLRPAGGAPCAPTYEADSGQGLIEGTQVNGSYSTQAQTPSLKAGQYLICLWLAGSPNETPAIAGPQPETFTVGTPAPPPPPPAPPPCLVPRVGSALSLAAVKRRLVANRCSVGRVRYAFSAHHRRGTVIGLSPRAGTVLPEYAAVQVLLSSGRRRHRRR